MSQTPREPRPFFQKRHYEAIATLMRRAADPKEFVILLIYYMEADNANFNRAKFLTAAGLTESDLRT